MTPAQIAEHLDQLADSLDERAAEAHNDERMGDALLLAAHGSGVRLAMRYLAVIAADGDVDAEMTAARGY